MPTDVISIVRRELEIKHVSFSELARRLQISRSSITESMKSHNMSVNRLMEITDILKFNFFREIASEFSYVEPLDKEKEELKERIKSLEFELQILRQIIKDK